MLLLLFTLTEKSPYSAGVGAGPTNPKDVVGIII
jgi:hypothetical protein